MKIQYSKKNGYEYFDKNGVQLFEGDVVVLPDGTWEILYKTGDDRLGIDATRKSWIVTGRAEPCEYGIYPLEESDNVEKCTEIDNATWFEECCIILFGRVHFDKNGNWCGDTLKLKEIMDDLIFKKDYPTDYDTAAMAMWKFVEENPDAVQFEI